MVMVQERNFTWPLLSPGAIMVMKKVYMKKKLKKKAFINFVFNPKRNLTVQIVQSKEILQ